MIFHFKPHFAMIIIILILSLIPLLWFKNGLLIDKGDLYIPLNPAYEFNNIIYVWNPQLSAGQTGLFFVSAPYYLFWMCFQFLGLSVITIEKIWFVFYTIVSGLSMYYLTATLIKDGKKYIAGLVSSVFYMFNMALVAFSPLTLSFAFFYPITPLILGLFAKGLNERKNFKKYSIYIGFVFSLLASCLFNMPILIVTLFLFLIYCIIINKNKKKMVFFILYTLFIIFLINIWWIIPSTQFILTSQNAITVSTSSESLKLIHRSLNSDFSNLFRLMGIWAWTEGFEGAPYYIFAYIYSENSFLLLITFLPFALILLTLILKYKNKNVIFFSILLLIFLFLAHGVQKPFGSVYNFLFENVPFFWIFREPYKFIFIVTVSCAFLLGVGVSEIYYRLKNLKLNKLRRLVPPEVIGKVFIIFVIVTFLIISWPLLTGDIIQPNRGSLPSEYVKIPEYWFELSQWINNQNNDFKVLLLPSRGFDYIWYNWESGYQGADIAPQLIQKPVIGPKWGYIDSNFNKMQNVILMSIVSETINEKILSLCNIKYILQRNDVNWTIVDTDSPDHIKSVLESQNKIYLEKSYGQLDLYKNDNFIPHIFASGNVVYVIGDTDQMIPLTSFKNFSTKDVFILEPISYENNVYDVNLLWDSYLYVKGNNETLKTNKLIIDNSVIDFYEKEKINDTYIFGKFYLTRGKHNISVSQKDTSNLIEDASFERGTWGIVKNCCDENKDKPIIFVSQSNDASDRKHSLNLTSFNRCACVSQTIKDFTPNTIYRISFEYKHIDGIPPRYCILFHGCEKDICEDLPFINGKWMHFEKNIKSNNCATNMELFFYSNAFKEHIQRYGNKTTNLYDNVTIKKVISVDAMIIEPTEDIDVNQKILFKKINPTKYKVIIENATQPFFLILSESYNPQWKAYLDKDFNCEQIAYYNNTNTIECRHKMSFTPEDISYFFKESLPEDNHLQVNGYANAWYIDLEEIGKKDFTITLYFWPQSLLYFGLIISGTTLIVCIAYLIYDWGKNYSFLDFRK